MSDQADHEALRRNLQELSTSDPAAQANMLRYVAALSMMVGRRDGERLQEGDAEIWATFSMSESEHNIQCVVSGRSKVGRMLLAFDVDDASGPPVNLCVIRAEGDNVITYGNCQLWSPAGVGRSMIVTAVDGSPAIFSFVNGRTLRLSRDPLPGNLELGIKRGWGTLVKLARSDQFGHIDGGHMHTIKADGPGSLAARGVHVSGPLWAPGRTLG